MAVKVSYSNDKNLGYRVWDHMRLALPKNIQEHKKNILEKIGDVGLWPLENLPRITWNLMSDPKVITVAATGLLMVADSYLFYSEETGAAVKFVWSALPTIPFWAAKFGTYVLSIEIISAFGARAEGRFTNEKLMVDFYGR